MVIPCACNVFNFVYFARVCSDLWSLKENLGSDICKYTMRSRIYSSPEMKKKIATKNIGHFVTGCGKKKKNLTDICSFELSLSNLKEYRRVW